MSADIVAFRGVASAQPGTELVAMMASSGVFHSPAGYDVVVRGPAATFKLLRAMIDVVEARAVGDGGMTARDLHSLGIAGVALSYQAYGRGLPDLS